MMKPLRPHQASLYLCLRDSTELTLVLLLPVQASRLFNSTQISVNKRQPAGALLLPVQDQSRNLGLRRLLFSVWVARLTP